MTDPNDVDMKNYFRLEILQTQACELLRNLFRQRWKSIHGTDWDQCPDLGHELVHGIGQKIYKNAKRLQKRVLEDGDINHLDLTTICQLLQNLKFGPAKQARAIQAEIDKIIQVRNKLAHHPNKTFSQSEFDSHWNKVSGAMILLGYNEDKIKELYFAKDIGGVKFPSQKVINEVNTTKANKLKEDSNTSFQNGDFQDSIDLLGQAIRLKELPEDLLCILYSTRSAVLLKKSTTDDKIVQLALDDAKRAIRYNPTWWKGYFRLGCAYEAKGKLEKAINAFNRSLGTDPSQSHVRSSRDGCTNKLAIMERTEHLDPTRHVKSMEEAITAIKIQRGLDISSDKVEETFTAFRKSGDPYLISMADMYMAKKYLTGLEGVPQNYEEAAKLFAKASVADNADALFNLGSLTEFGKGVVKDIPLALDFYSRAARQPPIKKFHGTKIPNLGVAEAQHRLGLWYADGVGVDQNFVMAKSWYEKACQNGSKDAANNLANLYDRGNGVEANSERAIQYWKLAASRGNVLAMDSLSIHYGQIGDMKQSKHWWKCALDNGSLVAPGKAEVYNLITADDDKQVKKIPAEIKQCIDNLEEINIRDQQRTLLPLGPPRVFPGGIDTKSLMQSASNGSITAQGILRAMQLSSVLQFFILLGEDCNYMFMIESLAEAYRIQHIAVIYPMKEEEIELLTPFVTKKLKEVMQGPPTGFEKNLRICYLELRSNALQEMEVFTEESIKRFPNESHFLEKRGCILGFLKKYEKYLSVVDEDLKKFPNHVEITYNKAVHLRLIDGGAPEDTIEAYKQFLKLAPSDHRKVPESYYAIASSYLILQKLADFKKYYEMGLNAEKSQLSCFLPYRSDTKKVVENYYKLATHKVRGTKNIALAKPAELTPVSPLDMIKLSDPQRVELILDHRTTIKEYNEFKKTNVNNIPCSTQKPKHVQRTAKKLTGLKPITLSKMDITKDHVYEGFVLQVSSIDDAATGFPSIMILLQDENGDVQRCFVYNIPQNDEAEVQRKLGFGANFSILNPYMRMAAKDFKPAIRIDDPNSIVFHSTGDTAKKCRFCFSDNPVKTCSRCKRAKYCSQICQSHDWKILNHKILCTRTTVK